MPDPTDDLMTKLEVARRLRCSVRFIEKEVRRRRLFRTRLGRKTLFSPAEVARYIAANTESEGGRPAAVVVPTRRKGGKLPPVPQYV